MVRNHIERVRDTELHIAVPKFSRLDGEGSEPLLSFVSVRQQATSVLMRQLPGDLKMQRFRRQTISIPRISVRHPRTFALSFGLLVDGVSAGFAATLAMSAVMLLNDRMSLIPQVDLIRDLRHVIQILMGLRTPFLLAWLIHLILGSYVFGCVFAIVFDHLSGGPVMRGVYFGLAIWLLLMLTAFPLLGYGFFGFGMALGAAPAAATLVLHLVYGLALGFAFGSVHTMTEPGK
jgi:uncharacterized membrane protein YagU involved in acid resistance